MSVDRDEIVMVGVKLDYSLFNWQEHEKETSGAPHRRFDAVADLMGGEYFYVGTILCRSDKYEGFWDTSFDFDRLNKIAEEVQSTISNHFGIQEKPRLIAFTHYS